MTWRCGSMIGLPDMRPSSLRKAMTEPVKVIAPMATPSDHLDQARAVDRAGLADAEGLRRVERAGRDQHGREADQRVEERPRAAASPSSARAGP